MNTRIQLNDNEHNLFRLGVPEGTVLIIFGASGDLTRRKIMPALYHLSREDLLPQKFLVIGIGRRIQDTPDFRVHMKHRVIQYCSHKMEKRYWFPLERKLMSIRANFNDDKTFNLIADEISKIENEWNMSVNKLFYLATSPSHFSIIIKKLVKSKLCQPNNNKVWTRLIIEKPFGLDLNSANTFNKLLMQNFNENQIYRIDHYSGKEAVYNILIFRMANIIFQPLWSKDYIDHVQITIAETIGVEGRVDFFEQTGVIRDMMQSHILQIMAFFAMELPTSMDTEEIRNKKVEFFKSVIKYESDDEIKKNVLRAQYVQGVVNSELVPAYRSEPGVNPNSFVETYAIIRLFVNNSRWQGVPFYLRTGKRMPKRKTEIYIQFKSIDISIPIVMEQQKPIINSIRLEIQPNAGVEIRINWKPPGILSNVVPTILNMANPSPPSEPKAYERLLVDAMRGNSTLFIRFDEIQEMWKIIDPIVKYWERKNEQGIADDLYTYPAGTQGPKEAKRFIRAQNRFWNKI